MPRVVVIGGPNGAGKSTCSSRIVRDEMQIPHFVNADTLARGLSAWAPESMALKAGRLMLNQLHELASQRKDFAFESTLASRSFAPFLRGLKAEGYTVGVYYLWIQSPDLSVQRVVQRTRTGGHFVPEDVVRQRYLRGLMNFAHMYRTIADFWVLCENSEDDPRIIAEGGAGELTKVVESDLYEEFERRVNERQAAWSEPGYRSRAASA